LNIIFWSGLLDKGGQELIFSKKEAPSGAAWTVLSRIGENSFLFDGPFSLIQG
jgi:hypothetical protein